MRKLLLVEDDRDQMEVRRLLFEAQGFEVETAATLETARTAAAECAPDTVLMDLRLPEASQGLELVRYLHTLARRPRILVLTGWPDAMRGAPEEAWVETVLEKPCPTRKLIAAVARSVLALMAAVLLPAATRSVAFELPSAGHAVAELTLRSPKAQPRVPGEVLPVIAIERPGAPVHHLTLAAGAAGAVYRVQLGHLAAGRHTVTLTGEGFELDASRVSLDDSAMQRHAPVLFARANTLGRSSDVPLLMYAEASRQGEFTVHEYTVIFSNEDGGTSTRALMARWGRTTDIEYIYRVYLDAAGQRRKAIIQTRNHQDVAYAGPFDGDHPLLVPVTDNNMVAGEAPTAIRYQLAPVLVDLSRESREAVMDRAPWMYRAMSEELERESKLRPFGTVDGQKISRPENYLYVELKSRQTHARVAVRVRLRDEALWRASHLGRADYAIERSGWMRSTVELPPGTSPDAVAEIGAECLVDVPSDRSKPAPAGGSCEVEAISKVFFLAPGGPGPSLFRTAAPRVIQAGETAVWKVR
ncbi:MAG: response regulator [Acidobacteria bacterium]|nr:response regulator [Acidobacteriota bacterium]